MKKTLGIIALALLASTSLPAAHKAAATEPVPVEKPYTESYVGEMGVHETVYEDTLIKIARDYDLGFVELRAANPPLDPWMPGADIDIVLPAMHILPAAKHEGIIINLPEMRLYALVETGQPDLLRACAWSGAMLARFSCR